MKRVAACLTVGFLVLSGCGGEVQRGPREKALSLSDAAKTSYELGDLHIAGVRYQKALRKSRSIDDQRAVGRDLHNYGMVLMAGHLYSRAAAHFDEAALLHARSGEKVWQAESLLALGEARYRGGETDSARDALQQCIELCGKHSELQAVHARAQASLGVVAAEQGHYDEAERIYREAGDVACDCEDTATLALVTANMGRLQARRGKHAKAIEFYEKARDLYQKAGNAHGVADTLSNWAESAVALAKQDMENNQRLVQTAYVCRRAAHAANAVSRFDVAAALLARAALMLGEAGKVDGALEARTEAMRMLADFKVERFRNWPPGYEGGPSDTRTLKEAERLRLGLPPEHKTVPRAVRQETIHRRTPRSR
jgi:tetratricopeptide (TPR) repeat protein